MIGGEYRRLLRSTVQLTSPPPKAAPLSRLQSSAISISRISPSVVLTARPPLSGRVTPGAGALRASSGQESQESPSASMRRLRVDHESVEDLHLEAGSASELEEEQIVTSAPPSARRGRVQVNLSEAGDELADPPAPARGTRRGRAKTRVTRVRPPGWYKSPVRARGEVPPSWGVSNPPVAEKAMLTMQDNTLATQGRAQPGSHP